MKVKEFLIEWAMMFGAVVIGISVIALLIWLIGNGHLFLALLLIAAFITGFMALDNMIN